MNRITILVFAAAAALSFALIANFRRGANPPNSQMVSTTNAQEPDPSPQPAAASTPADSFQAPTEATPARNVASTGGWKSPTTPPPRVTRPQLPVRADLGPLARSTPAPSNPADLAIPQLDEPIVPKEVARAALSLVGADEEAEEIWAAAINDPAMPAEVRKDLIEDLNEDGFPDPKHITEDDLPLILSRLELIEAIAPHSMDETNYEAFRESYKDLVNMLDKLNR